MMQLSEHYGNIKSLVALTPRSEKSIFFFFFGLMGIFYFDRSFILTALFSSGAGGHHSRQTWRRPTSSFAGKETGVCRLSAPTVWWFW